MSRLLTAMWPARARTADRATAAAGTNSQASRSLNRTPKTTSEPQARRKSCHTDLASTDTVSGSFMAVSPCASRLLGVVVARTLPPGPGMGQEADLGQGDPEAGQRDEKRGGRDPREGPGLQLLRPLTDFRHPGYVFCNESSHRVQSLFDPGQLGAGCVRLRPWLAEEPAQLPCGGSQVGKAAVDLRQAADVQAGDRKEREVSHVLQHTVD